MIYKLAKGKKQLAKNIQLPTANYDHLNKL
jgi:hypothetical protein